VALPTLDKTWLFKVNQEFDSTASAIADYRRLIRAIKTALVTDTGWTDSANGAATHLNPWTVVASSDKTTADASDLWDADSKLVWNDAGFAHSWIVLRQTEIVSGHTFELCIDCRSVGHGENTYYYNLSIAVSPAAGFDVSSPSVLNRPTASDECVLLNPGPWLSVGSSVYDAVLHVLSSDDGQCNRIIVAIEGVTQSTWLFDAPKSPVTGWIHPAIYMCLVNATTPTYVNLNDSRWILMRAPNADGSGEKNGLCYLSTEFYNSGGVGQIQTTVNSITSEWPMTRMGIVCTTPGIYGRHGEVYDMWFGCTTTIANGDTYPGSGTTKQFVQINQIVLPWNTTTPLMTT
jgi:hypothetical protein